MSDPSPVRYVPLIGRVGGRGWYRAAPWVTPSRAWVAGWVAGAEHAGPWYAFAVGALGPAGADDVPAGGLAPAPRAMRRWAVTGNGQVLERSPDWMPPGAAGDNRLVFVPLVRRGRRGRVWRRLLRPDAAGTRGWAEGWARGAADVGPREHLYGVGCHGPDRPPDCAAADGLLFAPADMRTRDHQIGPAPVLAGVG